ncbi:drebrin isoform X1 [Callorhinchus milii]|uniref:drebrin isoform X1 n=1 Tax=Callorhinchus milii TaxID=7868 RepID=UPI0004575AA3|nr:drebrin isoform X1 [Callorhinchus milii]|eukprot:gi/632982328/ref/XP_007908077.1/ PREDICTED: drebrin isoform X1 [Callorhinchus milii]
MALNLSNNRLALLTAYEDVINEKTSTDWALYTYEEDTDNLKLADSGAGGLQEIAIKFDNQSVMYGFCSIKDSGSGLPKYVLINWVGEDVDDHRKCTCASHVATIADFFQGANVIVNASSPEDVDSTAIRQKLTNGTINVSSPVLRRLHLKEEEELAPVGTTYQKTNAAIEMKRINRELFWAQAKREEELRKEEERKKAIEEREKFEKERMEQEKKEQEERERRYREREKQIEEERKKLQNLETDDMQDTTRQTGIWDSQKDGAEEDDEEKRQSKISDSAEKAAEAAALIAQRDGNPREFFKQRERAMTTSFETVHFPGQKLAHQTQFESPRQEGTTSLNAPESSVVGTPIYEENEEFGNERIVKNIQGKSETIFQEQQPVRYEEPLPEQKITSYTEEPGLVNVWPEAPSFIHTEESVHISQAGLLSTEEQSLANTEKPQTNENLLDLWETNGIDELPLKSHSVLEEKQSIRTSTGETELILNLKSPPSDETVSTHAGVEGNNQVIVNFQESAGQPAGWECTEQGQQPTRSSAAPEEENLLCFDGNEGLPEPPPDCLDSQQWENLPSLIELEGPQEMSGDYCFGLQELPKSHDAEAVQEFVNQSQDEYIIGHVEETTSKIPEIDITYCDNDTDTDPEHSPAD